MELNGLGLCVEHSAEAVELYKEAFGLELGYHVLNPDGSYYHSELMNGDKEVFDVVEAKAAPGENPVQLGCTFEDEAALRRAFALLKENGKVLMEVCELPWSPCAAELVDRFGIRWYLTLPQHLPPEDFSPEDCVL